MTPPRLLQVFDPPSAKLDNYWLVRTSDGYFLVPAQPGGWNKRKSFLPQGHLIPLDGSQAEYVWKILTRTEQVLERQHGA